MNAKRPCICTRIRNPRCPDHPPAPTEPFRTPGYDGVEGTEWRERDWRTR